MSKITWHVETWDISKLKPYHKNPRAFTEKGMKDLTASLTKFGLADYPVINTDGTIIGGHARVKVLEQTETEIQVNIPNRKLTDKEVEELNIRLNANTAGEWDIDILANEFEIEEIVDWGLDLTNALIPNETAQKQTTENECPECGHKW